MALRSERFFRSFRATRFLLPAPRVPQSLHPDSARPTSRPHAAVCASSNPVGRAVVCEGRPGLSFFCTFQLRQPLGMVRILRGGFVGQVGVAGLSPITNHILRLRRYWRFKTVSDSSQSPSLTHFGDNRSTLDVLNPGTHRGSGRVH